MQFYVITAQVFQLLETSGIMAPLNLPSMRLVLVINLSSPKKTSESCSYFEEWKTHVQPIDIVGVKLMDDVAQEDVRFHGFEIYVTGANTFHRSRFGLQQICVIIGNFRWKRAPEDEVRDGRVGDGIVEGCRVSDSSNLGIDRKIWDSSTRLLVRSQWLVFIFSNLKDFI